MRWLDRFDSKT